MNSIGGKGRDVYKARLRPPKPYYPIVSVTPYCCHRHRSLLLDRGMLLSSTKKEPAHYMLKIESFSILFEAGTKKVASDVFEASGHKWRLILYPNGYKKDKGANHISLCLKLCDTESASNGRELHVDVKFFVYDHIRHNYVTFQDIHGNMARFHDHQIKWGFARLIPLVHFKDNSKGYLFNDSCVIGAEVFVDPQYTLKDRCLSLIKPPATMNTYTWTVDKFSAVTKNTLRSEVFKVGKVKWTLVIYPKGTDTGEGTHLSIFLAVHEAASALAGWRVYAKYELRVKNQIGQADRVKETEHWYCESDDDWGFPDFMLLSELRDTSNGFLLKDRIIVEAKISVTGMIKDFM